MIADVMNCSTFTVTRIVAAMTAAEKNDIDAVDASCEGHPKIKEIAKEFFGLTNPPQDNDESTTPQITEPPIEPINPALLEKICTILESNNRLLASIAAELGIK